VVRMRSVLRFIGFSLISRLQPAFENAGYRP
jgi:hypothetical protein